MKQIEIKIDTERFKISYYSDDNDTIEIEKLQWFNHIDRFINVTELYRADLFDVDFEIEITK